MGHRARARGRQDQPVRMLLVLTALAASTVVSPAAGLHVHVGGQQRQEGRLLRANSAAQERCLLDSLAAIVTRSVLCYCISEQRISRQASSAK